MTAPTLQTDRLVIRAFRDDDAERYASLIFSNPNVMGYLAGGGHDPEKAFDTAQRAIATRQQEWRSDSKRCGWAVAERDTDLFIGYVGLFPIQALPTIEIAYGFGEPYWGKGYATEAASAVLRYGFEVLALDRIVGLAFAENIASRRVLTKIGLREIGATDQYYGVELIAYERTRADDLAGQS